MSFAHIYSIRSGDPKSKLININKRQFVSGLGNDEMNGSDNDPEHDDAIYQNYSASEVLVQGLAGVVSQDDVGLMVLSQKEMLQRFEKTNEMLINVNNLSTSRLDMANKDFKNHTQNMLNMKRDLEHIFKRLKLIKEKLKAQCPEAYSSVIANDDVIEEEDDEYDTAIKARKVIDDSSSSHQNSKKDNNQLIVL